MDFSHKLDEIGMHMQESVKQASTSLMGLLLKLFTSFILGLTFSLIGQEMIGYQTLGFVFIFITGMVVIMRVLQKWSIKMVLTFDLICLLVAILLRNYILLAP